MSIRWLTPVIAALLLWQGLSAVAQSLDPDSPLDSMKALAPEDAGDVLLARQQYLEAIDAYNRAPMSADVLNKIGVAWHHLSAIGQARHEYEEALRLRPDYAEALNNLASTYFAQKNYRQALRLFRRASVLDPNSAIIEANVGTTLFAQGKTSPGTDAYHNAIALDPQVFDKDSPQRVHGPVRDQERARQDYCLAAIFAANNDDDDAILHLRRAIAEGFHDWKRLMHDDAFAELRANPEFEKIMVGS